MWSTPPPTPAYSVTKRKGGVFSGREAMYNKPPTLLRFITQKCFDCGSCPRIFTLMQILHCNALVSWDLSVQIESKMDNMFNWIFTLSMLYSRSSITGTIWRLLSPFPCLFIKFNKTYTFLCIKIALGALNNMQFLYICILWVI